MSENIDHRFFSKTNQMLLRRQFRNAEILSMETVSLLKTAPWCLYETTAGTENCTVHRNSLAIQLQPKLLDLGNMQTLNLQDLEMVHGNYACSYFALTDFI